MLAFLIFVCIYAEITCWRGAISADRKMKRKLINQTRYDFGPGCYDIKYEYSDGTFARFIHREIDGKVIERWR